MPRGPACLQYAVQNGTGRRMLLLLALDYRSAVHAPQINERAGCVSSQFTCYRNNAGLEPELTQLRFGCYWFGGQRMAESRWVLPAFGGRPDLCSSTRHLHPDFHALVNHSLISLNKVLLLEQIDSENVRG